MRPMRQVLFVARRNERNTAISVCDERIATAMADNGETPICPICGKKTVCTLYEFCTPENPNIIEDVKWR